MINVESMKERVLHLQERIKRLKELQPAPREKFFAGTLIRDAVERNFQVAIECCLDIAKHIVVVLEIERPNELRDVFHALGKANFITPEFAETMSQFGKMRNLLVHHYTTVDPVQMYEYLQNDIPHLEKFASIVLAFIESETRTGG